MHFKLNAGIGVKASNFMLNYGFVPTGELGGVQRMSVTLRFGETGGLRRGDSITRRYAKTKAPVKKNFKAWKSFK